MQPLCRYPPFLTGACRRLLALVVCLLFCLATTNDRLGVLAFQPAVTERRVVVPPEQKRHHPTTKLVHQSSVSVDVVAESPITATSSRRRIPSLVADSPAPAAKVITVPPPVTVPLVQLALAGSATTFFADACIHPVDCIKTIQQSDMGTGLGFAEAAGYLWDTSGLQGFFNGLLTYAVSDGMGGAIKFSVWETWKKHIEDTRLVWVGAALAFCAASIVIVPGEFLKQQLQMSHFDSLTEAALHVYRNDGVTGFYTGYNAVILRDVPHTILELCLYDVLKRAGNSGILAACLTGCVAGFLTTPMDAIKTKIMVEGSAYDSLWDCVATTLDAHGWGGIWAGALARVLWIAPFTMLYLPTYDFLHKTLLERQQYQVSDLQYPSDSPSSSASIDIDCE